MVHPDVTLVPTADIALLWHTHLGLSGDYVDTCRRLLGEEAGMWGPDYLHLDPAKLMAAYGETAKLYEQNYGESSPGTPDPPGDTCFTSLLHRTPA